MNKEEKSIIENYTINLTERVKSFNQEKSNSEQFFVGREKEIKEIISVLLKIKQNNPLLLGNPGVGKTAIVYGLIQKIISLQIPDELRGKEVYQLDLMSLISGAKYQGELEERLKAVLNFMKDSSRILFIDEIHLITSLNKGSQSASEISNFIKPLLAEGEISCIGATTFDDYRKYFEIADKALVRRFSNIVVEEPSIEENYKILLGIKPTFENHYKVKILDEALLAVVKLSARYLGGFFPDKAIKFLDEILAREKTEGSYPVESVVSLSRDLNKLQKQLTIQKDSLSDYSKLFLEQEITKKEKLIQTISEKNQQEKELISSINDLKEKVSAQKRLLLKYLQINDLNKVAEIKNFLLPLSEEKLSLLEKEAEKNEFRKYFVNEKDVACAIARKISLPVGKIIMSEREKTIFLPVILRERIKGQDEVIQTVSDSILRSRSGIVNPNRPIASFLFAGPTGVGKTEMSLTISEQLFDNEKKNFFRFDMTEFSQAHTISALIGSPPGFIGYEKEAALRKINSVVGSVVLFDEVEKCHPEIMNVFLQMLDNGILTLANGEEVNFRNSIIIFTTNLGAEFYQKKFDKIEIKNLVEASIKERFLPEFINRLDETIFFNSLDKQAVLEIIDRELRLVFDRIYSEKGITFEANSNLKNKILLESYSFEYGARPIKRYIERKIVTLIARGIILGSFAPFDKYSITVNDETKDIEIHKLNSLLEVKISKKNK